MRSRGPRDGSAGRNRGSGPGGRPPLRVLLVQLPFAHLGMPGISLSLLRSALVDAGVDCDIEYRHFDFAAAIGPDLYTDIAIEIDSLLLFGDLVFAPHIWETGPDLPAVRRSIELSREQTFRGVPRELLAAYPELVSAAGEFLDRTIAEIEWSRYGLVGLSTTFQLGPALALSRRLKRLASPPPVVLGGTQCEGDVGRELLRVIPWVDFAADGEGEELIVGLARALAARAADLSGVPGLIWRKGRAVRANALALPAGTGHYDLDRLPRPRYDDWIQQATKAGLVPPSQFIFPIETSRGCWWGERHRCSFCGFSAQAVRYRRKSPGRALSEFRDLASLGVTMIRSVDSILDLEYFESLLPELAAWDSGLRIFYEVKANLNRRQMEALGNAGIRWLQPGIESLSTPALRLMGKGITAWRNVRTLRYGAELAMSLSWNLLAGFPGEEPSWYQEMVPLVEALTHLQPPSGLVYVRLDRFSPLYDLRETNGLAEVRPAPGYGIIFRTNPASLARLAMHFTFRYADSRDPSGYLAPLAAACDSWRAEAGRAVFLSTVRGGAVELYDTRAIAAGERVTLRGVEAVVFQACRDGATAGEVARKAAASGTARTVRRALERLVERRWVARIDDRYLSLAVSVAEQGEDGGPDLAELAARHAGLMARRMAVQTRPPLSFDRLHSRPGRGSPAASLA